MTATEIKDRIRRYTNTNSNDYTDAQIVADFNAESSLIHIGILRDRGTLEFDDSNYSDLPVATFAITAGTREYKITVDENSNEIFSKHKVGVLLDGQYQDIPRLQVGEGNQEALLTKDTDTMELPGGYYEIGESIVFKDMPSTTTTGKVWFDRAMSFLVEGDTTKVPGFPTPYHKMACIRVALSYEHLDDKSFNRMSRLADREMILLEEFESTRREDEATAMTVVTPNGL
jgi:hypothetical protein